MIDTPDLFSPLNKNTNLLIPSYIIGLKDTVIQMCSSFFQHLSVVIATLETGLFGRPME
jgi:hypothetical protein